MSALETRALGTTGIQVTRFASGGHFTVGPKAHDDIPRRVREINHMIDRGITYFDVQWEPEELAMAEVLKTRADEIAVAWPLHGVWQRGKTGELTPEYILDYCDDHRRRFGIEHVEVLLWIGLILFDDTEAQTMDAVRTAVDKLKADGFCDHFGFSCHYSPEMALRAIENHDIFEVMMVPYCPLHPKAGQVLLPRAHEKGIGVVTMKPFGGATGFHNMVCEGKIDQPAVAALGDSPLPYQAAIRWVLQDPHVDCVVPGTSTSEQFDQLLEAAQTPFAQQDQTVLRTLEEALAQSGDEVAPPLRAQITDRRATGRPWG